MKSLWTLLVLIAALVNLAPAVGAILPDRMVALYGIGLEDPNLQILMRHRAVLFGIVGGVLVLAAFRRPLRSLGYVVGFTSMVSFAVIAWAVGGYSAQLQRIVLADVAGIASLAAAGIVHFVWLRRPPDPEGMGVSGRTSQSSVGDVSQDEDTTTDLVALVREAVGGHTAEDPQGLVGILGYVDGREKLVLTRDELAGALERLIGAGQVVEVSRHRFCECTEREVASSFSGLSAQEHEAACASYKREFRRKYRELTDG